MRIRYKIKILLIGFSKSDLKIGSRDVFLKKSFINKFNVDYPKVT